MNDVLDIAGAKSELDQKDSGRYGSTTPLWRGCTGSSRQMAAQQRRAEERRRRYKYQQVRNPVPVLRQGEKRAEKKDRRPEAKETSESRFCRAL